MTADENVLTTGFGIVALILATIGVYGVMAGVVARRVRFICGEAANGLQAVKEAKSLRSDLQGPIDAEHERSGCGQDYTS